MLMDEHYIGASTNACPGRDKTWNRLKQIPGEYLAQLNYLAKFSLANSQFTNAQKPLR